VLIGLGFRVVSQEVVEQTGGVVRGEVARQGCLDVGENVMRGIVRCVLVVFGLAVAADLESNAAPRASASPSSAGEADSQGEIKQRVRAVLSIRAQIRDLDAAVEARRHALIRSNAELRTLQAEIDEMARGLEVKRQDMQRRLAEDVEMAGMSARRASLERSESEATRQLPGSQGADPADAKREISTSEAKGANP